MSERDTKMIIITLVRNSVSLINISHGEEKK